MKFQLAAILVIAFSAVSFAQGIVPITGTSIDVSMAKYSPIPAQANDYVTVWFDVINRGTKMGENITFILEPKYPFSLPDNNPRRVVTVPALESIRLEYRLFVDKNAPDAPGQVDLKYVLGQSVTATKGFNITVNNTLEEATLHTLFSSASPNPYPGGTSTVSIDVVNANKGTAYYVLARASSPVAQISSDEVFIGTLEPNDFDNVEFELKINSDVKPGAYPVALNFIYRDKDSNLYNDTDFVNINVVSAAEAQPAQATVPAWMYIVYVAAILVAIRLLVPFVKWFIKPFRRKKSKGQE